MGLGSASLKKTFTQLNQLGGTSFSNIKLLTEVLQVLSAREELSSGVEAIKQLCSVMKSFDGSPRAINDVVSALEGLSDKSKTAVLSMFELNEIQAERIFTMIGLQEEELKTAVATVTAGNAAKGAAGGFAAFTASVKSAATGLITFLTTNPVGWAILAAGAIFGAVKAYDALSVSAEEAAEKMEESFSEFETAQQKVDSLNSELEATKDRIDELETKGGLTFVEKQELEKLRESVHLLKIQADLAERVAAREGAEAADNAVESYRKNYKHEISASETDKYQAQAVSSGNNLSLFSDNSNISAMIAGIRQFSKLRDESTDQEDWLEYNEAIQEASDSIWEQATILADYQSKLESIPESYRSEEQQEILNEIASAIEYIYQELDHATWKQMKLDDILSADTFAQAKQDLIDIANASDNVGVSASDVQSYHLLTKELEKAGITAQEFADYINSEAGIIDYGAISKKVKETFSLSNKITGLTGSERKEYLDSFNSWIDGLSDEELRIVYDVYCNTDTADWTLAQWKSAVEKTSFDVYQEELSEATGDVNELISGISTVRDILSEQSTGASLSLDDYNAEELKDYTSALEYNNGTLQLNAEKVNELVKAKADEQIAINNTNKAIAQSKYLDNVAEIERLRRELKQYGDTENSTTDSINNQINALIAENDTLRSTCTQYDIMTSSLQEATSAYQHWINAQSAAESGDMFDDTVDALNHIYDTLNEEDSEFFGRVGREDYQAAVDLIIPDSVDVEDTEAVNSYLDSIYSLFTYDDDGNYAGLNIENFCKQAVEAGLMTLNEAGDSYEIVGEKTIEDFANGMNLALPLVQAMFGEIKEFDAKFTWADEANKTIGDLAVSADVAAQKLRELNPDLTLELDVSYLETAEEKVSTLDNTIAQMQELKVDADATEVEYANSVISYCVAQKQQLEEPAIMDVDVSQLSESAAEAVTMMQKFQTAYNNLELKKALGVDTTEAQAEVDALFAEISSSDNDYLVSLGLDAASVETLHAGISNLETPEILATFNIDETALLSYEPEGKTATVTYDIDTTKVDAYDPDNLKRTVTYYVETVGSVGNQIVNGTAHVTGTAYAGGNWGTAPGGKTLVGELGQEIVVDPHTGRWYTVGDTGAEFRDIPRGAIVFNHKQSESLLKNGYVAGRASALAGGTAMLGGGISVSSASNSTVSGGYRTSNYKKASTSATSSTSTSSSSSTSTAEETLEKLDWIEIALDRIQSLIDIVKNKATSAYKSLSSKLSASKDELGLITEELDLQQKAYDRYMQEANSVGLDAGLAELVQTGAIDIEEYDEETRELISNYQEWYEKALACSDAIDELHERLAELYSENFDNVQSDFESRLSQFDHLVNSYNADIDMLEAKGYLATTTYYEGLKDVEKQRVAMLQSELTSLKKTLADAMASGEIEEGSEAWYDMRAAIDEVEEAIDEANLSLQEYIKTIRQIKWDNFDYGLERISRLTSEADFLIDLLDNKDLFDDKGNLTDEGLAIMGLYGQNYNTYMAQADEYGKEIANVEKQLAEDPSNTDLIDRLETLRDAQWECVQAAEEQKQSMIDLAEEGINAQIDAMDTLIEKYSDLLDSSKDLYEYRKKITGYTDDIKSLKKQLSAYEGDTSEESRATIQKLKVSLKEAEEDLESAEYDHFVSETKKLLSDLGESFESALTERLDDTDALIKDVIGEVNTSASSISETITKAASDVGVTLTQNMSDVWNSDSEDGVLSTYGSDFSSKLTSINTAVQGILTTVSSMISLSGTDLAISELASKGVVNTPAYWQNAVASDNVKWLPELLAKLSENAGSEVVNDFTDPYKAIDYLETNGVINTGDYWKNILKSGELEWLGQLLLNAANHTIPKYKTGGLATATGLAQLDGTANRPELVLDAQDTENFLELKDTLQSLQHQELTKVPSYPEFASFIGSELCDGLLRIAKEGSLIEPVFEGVPLSDKVLKLIELESEHAATMNKLVEDIASIANIAKQTNTIGATNTFGDINIAIDHVEDYNDFVTQLQHDKEFERMFSDMLNSATGMGSSFAKYKRSWNK